MCFITKQEQTKPWLRQKLRWTRHVRRGKGRWREQLQHGRSIKSTRQPWPQRRRRKDYASLGRRSGDRRCSAPPAEHKENCKMRCSYTAACLFEGADNVAKAGYDWFSAMVVVRHWELRCPQSIRAYRQRGVPQPPPANAASVAPGYMPQKRAFPGWRTPP